MAETWEGISERGKNSGWLTPEEKKELAPAISNLKQTLGENFLEKASSSDHPLNILFGSDFSYPWVIWFSHSLTELKKQGGYENLLKLIADTNNKDGFSTTIPVLETVMLLSKRGYSISHVEPDKKGGEHRPDLKIKDPDLAKELAVEVTVKFEPSKVIKAHSAYLSLGEMIQNKLEGKFDYGGDINAKKGTLGDSELESIEKQLVRVANSETKTIKIGELVNLVFIRKVDGETLPEFAKGGIHNYPYRDATLIKDFIETLDEKLKQHPNIIIVQSHVIPMYMENQMSIVKKVEDWLTRHPKILSVVIMGHDGTLAPDQKYTNTEDHISENCIFIRRLLSSREARRYLVFRNPNCSLEVYKTLFSNLLSAYLNS